MIDVEVNGRQLTMTIRRPEARNAVNEAVARGIEAAIDRLEDDDDLWVGIIAGEAPVFCAGADLKEVQASGLGCLGTERGGFAGIVQRHRTKPIIAAVDGPALAGGCEIVLACDLVVASPRARFGIPEVKRCLVAAAGGLVRLPRKLPVNVAMEMALTGDPISAERAHHFGLVNVLCEEGEALSAAGDLAERVCANAPLAVRESREVLLGALLDEDEGWRRSGESMARLMTTEDVREGVDAFVEKRAPRWQGR